MGNNRTQYKSFIFGDTLRLMLNEMDDAERLHFYDSICAYGLDGTEPEMTDKRDKIIWIGIRTLIDNLRPRRGAPESNANAAKENFPSVPDGATIENSEKQLKTNRPNININKNMNINKNTNTELESESETEFEPGPEENPESRFEKEKTDGVCVEKPKQNDIQGGLSPPNREKPPEGREYDKYAALHPGQSPPKGDDFETIRKLWNTPEEGIKLPECRFLLTNLNSGQSEILASAMTHYSTGEITDAIVNYKWMQKNPDKVRVTLKFGNLFNFLDKGLPTFSDVETFDTTYLKT